ncbi:MAG TPA: sulfatase, partial [Mycobacteriales bacterium]
MVDWDKVGDGSIFDDPAYRQGGAAGSVVGDPAVLRTSYINSIRYSLTALISYVQRYGDKNLVLVFLGDHQPSPVLTGPASRDVPITIVAAPDVLASVAGWNWTPGLRPDPKAPVWRMDLFRNRFLTAYGSTPVSR